MQSKGQRKGSYGTQSFPGVTATRPARPGLVLPPRPRYSDLSRANLIIKTSKMRSLERTKILADVPVQRRRPTRRRSHRSPRIVATSTPKAIHTATHGKSASEAWAGRSSRQRVRRWCASAFVQSDLGAAAHPRGSVVQSSMNSEPFDADRLPAGRAASLVLPGIRGELAQGSGSGAFCACFSVMVRRARDKRALATVRSLPEFGASRLDANQDGGAVPHGGRVGPRPERRVGPTSSAASSSRSWSRPARGNRP